MFHLTQQERFVLCVFAWILFMGMMVEGLHKHYPFLADILHLIEDDRLRDKLDVNSATKEDLVAIPYIGEFTAQRIIQTRTALGGFTDLEQIKNIKGIYQDNYEHFSQWLRIKPSTRE